MTDGILTQLQTAWEQFTNWLGSIGQTLNETYGQLGQGILSGLVWLGERIRDAFDLIKSGLEWLANKLREAYEALAQWVWNGLQWIGSGLSWIGANIYKFGQWVYTTVVDGIGWIIKALENAWNWFVQQLLRIWNALCGIPNSFVTAFNEWFNNMIKLLRNKLLDLIVVNITVPAMLKSIEEVPERLWKANSFLDVLKAIAPPFLMPIFGAAAGKILDAILPVPHSQTVPVFFPLGLPQIAPANYPLTKVETVEKPEPVKSTDIVGYEQEGSLAFDQNYETQPSKTAGGLGVTYDVELRPPTVRFLKGEIELKHEIYVTRT